MTTTLQVVEHFEDITRYATKNKGKIELKNAETDEVIELDERLASAVMCATLAYAGAIIAGACDICDADDGHMSIILLAAEIYARDL